MSSETACAPHGFSMRRILPAKSGTSFEKPVPSPAEHRRPRSLQCLKIAALAVAILIALCLEARSEQVLSAQDIAREIVGHSFRGQKGILSVRLNYGQDGTVTMRSALGTGQGNWTLSDSHLCVTLVTGPRKGGECLTFIRQSDGEYRASNGMRLTLTP